MKNKFNLIGWGRKRSGLIAIKKARKRNLSFEINEDGFISRINRSQKSISLIKDDIGIYYDATAPSKFESLAKEKLSAPELIDSKCLIKLFRKYEISKYNNSREYTGYLPKNYILLVDQVYGDLSVKYGNASLESFKNMLSSALKDYPDHKIVIKMHPDKYSRKKKCFFDFIKSTHDPRIITITGNYHSVGLINKADAVYTVTSQVGFEALIWGKKVKCFGMPFYAGWGLTENVLPAPKRRKKVSLEQLVYAALVKYPIYRDLETDKPTTVEKTIEYIGYQRKMRFRFPKTLYAYG